MWWAFSIATERFDTFALACAVSAAGDSIVFHEPGDVRDWYADLDASDIVWAHGGGGRDFLFLVGLLENDRWTGRSGGGTLLSARAKGHADCRDTMGLFPLPFGEWTGYRERLDLPCSCGDSTCEGRCSICASGMPRAQLARLVSHTIGACSALITALVRDVARLEREGLDVMYQDEPRLTLGSIAWRTAARMADVDPAVSLSWGEYDAGIRGRYGGRSEVGQVRAPSGHRYDLHAAYPAALTLPVPTGVRSARSGYSASSAYRRGLPGVYHASVYVPDGMPLVPHRRRVDNRGRGKLGKLLWTTGAMEGWWVREELHALERFGGVIERVHAAHVWSREDALYRPFVLHLWDARARAREAGDEVWSRVLKLAANSVSGKLQQGPDHDVIQVTARGDDPRLGWHWHGGRVWSNRIRHVPSCARPIEASVMLARTRVIVLERLFRHPDSWLYCDTDSTYLSVRDDRDVGAELGAWGYEGALSDWTALAPKLIRYLDENGEQQVRARGIPRATWETLDTLARGLAVSREGVARLRSSSGGLRASTITRSWSDANADGAQWAGMRRVLPDGRTRALHRTKEGIYT